MNQFATGIKNRLNEKLHRNSSSILMDIFLLVTRWHLRASAFFHHQGFRFPPFGRSQYIAPAKTFRFQLVPAVARQFFIGLVYQNQSAIRRAQAKGNHGGVNHLGQRMLPGQRPAQRILGLLALRDVRDKRAEMQ